jgi:hypothetical protein
MRDSGYYVGGHPYDLRKLVGLPDKNSFSLLGTFLFVDYIVNGSLVIK